VDLADMGGGDVFAYDDAAGHRTTFAWDSTGTFLDSVTSPIGTTSFTWNLDGSLDTITDANSHTWEYAYNSSGDPVSVTDPLSFVSAAEYDSAGRMTAVEDANSSRWEYAYDDKGNTVRMKDPLAEIDPLNRHQVDFVYDANDNVTSIQDTRGNTTTYTYDPDNQLSSVVDPLMRATTFACDPVGNVSSVSYPNGNATTFTYSDDDLLETIAYSSESTSWSFAYDPAHALSGAERNDGKTWAFTYDSGDRLATSSDENNSALGPFIFTYDYDDVSNLTGLDCGPLAPWGYTYNARDELTDFSGPGGTTSFGYDPGGRLTQVGTPDASTRTIGYDAAGRVSGVTNVTSSGTQNFMYSRDPGTSVLTSYVYDAAGNLTQVQEDGVPTESFGYDAANQITNAGFTYDENGNLTSDGSRTYTYDAEDRLVEVCDALGTLATMTYDFLDRRTSVTTADETTYFHYSGRLLVGESDASGAVTAAYTYCPAGLLSMTRGGQTYFYQMNAHGDVVSVTDSTGIVVNTYSYDPWGRVLSATEAVCNPMRYAGYYYDSTTGLYYLQHRFYDPGIRRFLTRDWLTGQVGKPQSLNAYAYVENNPLTYADPLGLEPGDYMGPYPGYDPSWEKAPYQNQRDPGNPTRHFSDPSNGPTNDEWQVHPGGKGGSVPRRGVTPMRVLVGLQSLVSSEPE
jgi:RHS repeat-associated protein